MKMLRPHAFNLTRSLFWLLMFGNCWTCLVQAQQLFPYGSDAKYDAMASAASGGSSAVFYNPAMIEAKSALYPELSYIRAMQSYEHPQFDKVKVSVNTPALSVGLSHLLNENYTLAFTTLPTRLGELEIPGLPRRIVGQYQPIIVKDRSTAFESGLGISYLQAQGVRFAFGILHSYLERDTNAWAIGNPALLLRVRTKNHFYRPIIGMSYTSETLSFASSITTEQKRPYKGRQISAASDYETESKTAGHEPLSMRFAWSYLYRDHSLTLSLNYLAHAKGKEVVSEGVTSEAKRAALKDIVERGLRYRFHLPERSLSLSVAAALLPTPWGGGVYDANDEERNTLGADFGQANNVTRRTFATHLSYQANEKLKIGCGSFYSYGNRTVGDDGDKPGFYQNQVFSLNTYTHWEF